MKHRLSVSLVTGLCVVNMLANNANAQCAFEWRAGEGMPGVNGEVYATMQWDPDGPGPQAELLIVGGSFSLADATLAKNIAAWDGQNWHSLGSGVNSTVRAL